MNVVYLGMAYDIFTPLALEPDVDVIHSIDIFDEYYGKTPEGQRQVIIDTINDGSNEKLLEKCKVDEFYGGCPCCADTYPKIKQFLKTKGRVISSRVRYGTAITTFEYDGKVRKLVQHYQNYNKQWPSSVKDISHIIGVGAFSFNDYLHPKLVEMIDTRTTKKFKVSVLRWDHLTTGWKVVPSILRNDEVATFYCANMDTFFDAVSDTRAQGFDHATEHGEEEDYRERKRRRRFYEEKIKQHVCENKRLRSKIRRLEKRLEIETSNSESERKRKRTSY